MARGVVEGVAVRGAGLEHVQIEVHLVQVPLHRHTQVHLERQIEIDLLVRQELHQLVALRVVLEDLGGSELRVTSTEQRVNYAPGPCAARRGSLPSSRSLPPA